MQPILFPNQTIEYGQNCLIFFRYTSKEKYVKYLRKFFINCKICKVPCTVYVIEFSWEEIERINQNHEDGIRKRGNFGGNVF